MAGADTQPDGIVARTAGEEAAEAAEARGGFRTPPERPDPAEESLARALALGEAAGLAAREIRNKTMSSPTSTAADREEASRMVRLDERDVAADLGAVDPAAVPSVQRPDGAPGFTEQYAGAKLTGVDPGAQPKGPYGLTVTETGASFTGTLRPGTLRPGTLRTGPPRRNPTSARILTAADQAIHSDRAEAYGPAEESFDRIAAFWTTHLRDKLAPGVVVDGYDVALLMVLMKVSRAATDTGDDTFVDIAGYGALAPRLAIFTGRGAS